MDQLYAELPEIDCKGLCHESCNAIAMTPLERERIQQRGIDISPLHMPCPALTPAAAGPRCRDRWPSVTAYDGITYVIPCGGRKLGQPAAARDLYTGSMFRHTLDNAKRSARLDTEATGRPARVLILSALHGLVELDTVLAPYDLRMDSPGSVTAARLAEQATALGIEWGAEVYALLPRPYLARLDDALRSLNVWVQDVYEACAGIGQQKRTNAHIGRGPVPVFVEPEGPGPTVEGEQARRTAVHDRVLHRRAWEIDAAQGDDPRWTPQPWDGARIAAGPGSGRQGFIIRRCTDGCEQVDGQPRWELLLAGGGPIWTCLTRQHLRPAPTVRREGFGRAACDYDCRCCVRRRQPTTAGTPASR
ncbi:DUF6884 domain-containing protein [Verrucosispora sp. TAA-831]|uniref:DUF6884 domain-containing protein n=1 Tax=Verrucosispora sp. TAA-831 TaxID=3422227 RepID=UPI003D700668